MVLMLLRSRLLNFKDSKMKSNILVISEQLPYFKAIVRKSLPARYRHLADDLAQDAILKSIEKVHLYDPSKGNFKSWLYRLTQNLCFDAIRYMDRVEMIPISANVIDVEYLDKNLDVNKLKKIRRAMKFLSQRDRMLITCRFMFNLNGREMASLTGIPENQINIYFQRAKLRLIEHCKKAA
jgi:RNA polymerase sigma factor (sigma-70 family)